MNFRTVLAITQKDIVEAVKNRYILISLIFPIAISLLMQLVLPSSANRDNLVIAVFDPGGSELVAMIQTTPNVRVIEADSLKEVAAQVEDNATGGFELSTNFDTAVRGGDQPEITIYYNRRGGDVKVMALQRLMEQQVWALSGKSVPAHINWKDVNSPSEIQPGNGAFQDNTLMTMFLMMSLGMTGSYVVPLLLVEEKETHTLDFLLISPSGPADVIAGKALTGMAYSLLIGGVLLGLNYKMVDDWMVTVLAVIFGALFFVAVGLLMGSFFETTMHVNTWASIITLVLISPAWLSAFTLPNWVDSVINIFPTYRLVEVLEAALSGDVLLVDIWDDISIMLAGAVIVYAAVIVIFRRESW